jgi:ribokinase
MQIVLNPSPMNQIINELPLEYVNYFLLNEIEAAQVLGEQVEEPAEIIAALQNKFPNAKVVLTLGGDGSMFSDGTNTVAQGIYKVKAVDTTAAGDTFTGYFIAGEAKGQEVKVSMDMAAKAAAITVSRPGAGVAIPTLDEVEKFNM